MILAHTWGEDRYYWVDFAQKLRDENFEVVILDLRGHGESDGDYEKYKDKAYRRMFMDLQAAHDYLKSLNKEMRIAVVGTGTGGLTALQTTKQVSEIHALTLLNPRLEFRGLKAENYISLFTGPLYIVGKTEKQKLLEQSTSEVKEFKENNEEDVLGTATEDIINWLKNNL